ARGAAGRGSSGGRARRDHSGRVRAGRDPGRRARGSRGRRRRSEGGGGMTDLLTRDRSAIGRARGRVLPRALSTQEIVLIVVLVVMWALLGAFTPNFLQLQSIQPLLANAAPIALIGVGMTVIIITAGIDISVASMLMVCAVVVAKLLVDLAVPL